MQRREFLTSGSALAGAGLLAPATLQATVPAPGAQRVLSAVDFGVRGDGRADDSAGLQAAVDTAFSADGTMLHIPPGTYRLSRTLRLRFTKPLTRQGGILASGARLLSTIADGSPVVEILSESTVRYLVIEGLSVEGSGKEGVGIKISCEEFGRYIYNFCLRDLVVQNCGGDGCTIAGNIFEGQIINCYFRDNRGSGAVFAHGDPGGILSAIHVIGCVFGQNRDNGVIMLRGCNDVGFHGCYFLLNHNFGLLARSGCTMLSHCGFENNHDKAGSFAAGDAGMWLQGSSTLIGCTAYSIRYQNRLLRAYISGQLTMIGCTGSGGGAATMAGLARLDGAASATATLMGCRGSVQTDRGFEALTIGGAGEGIRFGADWSSRYLPKLGDYSLWVDAAGRLRIKKGRPDRDQDGTLVGA
jgi:hypothetical protein